MPPHQSNLQTLPGGKTTLELLEMIKELETEQTAIGEAIFTLRRLAGNRGRRRGRPPAWMSDLKRRGRPPGSKTKPKTKAHGD